MFNSRKSFGEDISDLEITSDMWKDNDFVIKCLADVVIVNLIMLSSFMKDRINNNLQYTCFLHKEEYIFVEENQVQQVSILTKQFLSKQMTWSDIQLLWRNWKHGPAFYISRKLRHLAQIDTPSSCGTLDVWASCPMCITLGLKSQIKVSRKKDALLRCPQKILNDPLESNQMNVSRLLYELIHHVHYVRYIGPSDCKI